MYERYDILRYLTVNFLNQIWKLIRLRLSQAASKPKVTPKQDELHKDMNIENEILMSLYRKRDFGQTSERDRKEILTRQSTLKRLKKELKKVIQKVVRQRKLRYESKRKLESMDEAKRKKLTGKAMSDLALVISISYEKS